MNRLIISGYYGYDNLGDEAILAGIIHGFRKINSEIEITVLSAQPEVTAARYGVQAVSRSNPLGITRAIAESDLFISGGGSLLQDVTGWKTIPYYLVLVWLAQLLGKKTFFYAQGIGPVTGKLGKKLIKLVGNRTDFITVRDRESRDLLVELGVRPELIGLTKDPVFNFTGGFTGEEHSVDNFSGEDFAENFQANFKGETVCRSEPEDKDTELELLEKGNRPLIGVSVRPWQDNSYLSILVESIDRLAGKTGAEVVIIPMHYHQDQEISQELQERLEAASTVLTGNYTPLEMLDIFARFDFLIGVRLHSLIFAAVNHVPLLGISYDPKVESFLKSLGLETSLQVGNLQIEHLLTSLEKAWLSRQKIRLTLKDRTEEFQEQTMDNARQVIARLKGESIDG